jgi:AcrR family transcriptional regulator
MNELKIIHSQTKQEDGPMNDKKAEILRCARELFADKGFKDTNVAEIMKMAGMAVGTFYNSYKSKDRLFMEIYLEENTKLKRRILDSLDLDGDPMQVMTEMLTKNLEGMLADPILKQWYNRDVFQKIEQCWREGNGVGQVDFLFESFTEIVRKWQADGKMRRDISSGMIMAIFSALANIDAHKEEIGLEWFPDVQIYISDFIMKGLMDLSGEAGEAKNGA